ncbi:MAG: hypothetical protein WBF88_19780, partial [Pusillimonas sp.]
ARLDDVDAEASTPCRTAPTHIGPRHQKPSQENASARALKQFSRSEKIYPARLTIALPDSAVGKPFEIMA